MVCMNSPLEEAGFELLVPLRPRSARTGLKGRDSIWRALGATPFLRAGLRVRILFAPAASPLRTIANGHTPKGVTRNFAFPAVLSPGFGNRPPLQIPDRIGPATGERDD